MKIDLRGPSRKPDGYGLLLTLGAITLMLAFLASISQLTYTQSELTARNNLHNVTLSAAESATEMVLARMNRDYVNQSLQSLTTYAGITPVVVQTNWPVRFQFSDGQGNEDQTRIVSLGSSFTNLLNSQFTGLYGIVNPYRVISTAQALGARYDIPVTVQQDFQLVSIPVFQFAIFYSLDLELHPGPDMNINGKVHSNSKIYTTSAVGKKLQYLEAVTAVQEIYNNRNPLDGKIWTDRTVPYFLAQHLPKMSPLTLPIGTNNDPASVREILNPPPLGEDVNSPLAKERYYNKADLIITTTASGLTIQKGAWGAFELVATNAPFLATTNSLYDFREAKRTLMTEIDVGKLIAWMTNSTGGAAVNDSARAYLSHNINSIYVDDQRTNSGKLTSVRLVNGARLPSDGLTVATRLPLYVKGHFNLNNGTDTTVGQTNTLNTKPSSLVADAVTVLSSSWSDSYASSGSPTTDRQSRVAANATVNAAIISGIVKTAEVGGVKHYSGGAENFPRYLEDWGGKTHTYNGSMVVMFESRYATNWWANTDYYNPPTRRWAFDLNFLDYNKLPPGTPQVRKLLRTAWDVVSN